MDSSKWFTLEEMLALIICLGSEMLGAEDKQISVSTEESSSSGQNTLKTIDQSLYAQLPKSTELPENTVNSILSRAEELVTADNAITSAPVEETARMVKASLILLAHNFVIT